MSESPARRIDNWLRGKWAGNEADIRQARQGAILNDLRSRMEGENPSLKSVADSIAGHMPNRESAETYEQWLGNRNGAGREALYQEAAAASPMNKFQPHIYGWREGLAGAMSGTGMGNRAIQAGFYGGVIGGGVAAMTAAGQGLMALTQYLEEGNKTAVERDQELA